jgi:hypothetical protein
MTLLDRLLGGTGDEGVGAIGLHDWRALVGEVVDGPVTNGQLLLKFDVTEQTEIDALALLRDEIVDGSFGLQVAPLGNNPTRVQLGTKVNELIDRLNLLYGLNKMFDILALGETGVYDKAEVKARLNL